ncbi:MAG TPA: mevalonate kinase [Nitrosopumilaceae archaeon]|nr:mevalonate kinase [Nitrosopumilaceae archaeon]
MTSKASAPGKVILFGEHFVVYGIKAILAAINRRVIVTSSKINENKISIKSDLGELEASISKPVEKIDSPLKPFFYIAREMLQKFNSAGGISITIESEIPSGVGLGSSSACCVAGAASISNLFAKLSKEEIIELAIKAEQTIFKETSGADCTVCTYGGVIEYDKNGGFEKIDSPNDFTLVISNSGQTHSTNVTVTRVKKFKENNEEKFLSLCKKEEDLILKIKEALKKNDLETIGKSMSQNQDYLEQIGVSNENIRKMIMLAENKSYGAKITGAGDGGCIIALTDSTKLDGTINDLKGENYECFTVNIDSKGLDTF